MGEQRSGIVEQWYPGQVDGTAAAAVLFGTVNPSGHLPVTFPASLAQVPASTAAEFPGASGQVQYNEGIDVGYRWYQSQDLTPEFPFGFGLSYTTFSYSNLSITGFNSAGTATVTATVTNTGSRAGADVAQLYIGDPSSTGEPPWQLKDFQRVTLNPGASATVTFSVPVHDLTYWAGPGATSYPTAWEGSDPDGGGWTAPAGAYAIGVGDSSASLPLTGTLTLASPVGPDTVSLSHPRPAGDRRRLRRQPADERHRLGRRAGAQLHRLGPAGRPVHQPVHRSDHRNGPLQRERHRDGDGHRRRGVRGQRLIPVERRRAASHRADGPARLKLQRPCRR